MHRATQGWGKLAAWAAGAAMVAVSVLGATGCAIRTQGPIKEVAYDFSDHDFYDRSYAPSPKYLEPNEIHIGAVAQSAPVTAAESPLRKRRPVARFDEQAAADAGRPAAAVRGLGAATVVGPPPATIELPAQASATLRPTIQLPTGK